MCRRFLAPLAFLLLAPLHDARAAFLDRAVNVITDPLKIDAGTKNMIEVVERTNIMLHDAEEFAKKSGTAIDSSVRDYLRNVDNILGRAIGQAGGVVTQALNQVQGLEQQTFKDANAFVMCTGQVLGRDVHVTLADSLNTLGVSKPSITLFGWTIWSVKFTPQDITSPYDAYLLVRDASRAKLDAMKADDSAETVQKIFGDLIRSATETNCFYRPPNPLGTRIDAQIYEFRRLYEPWDGKVSVRF
ncbi:MULTISPECIES: hypothetical protein [Rhizobium]|uniref:Uncharacterized protein n=1 Tax=Rhizobium leguminosarum bv. viciae TaxID=387 RepID=A0A8G2IWX2_RHILV|nr:hypothetical protein [Rhizobium leguminosarum]NKK11422.1 hypothetical protein [Rhizobium leguminosarum bv. viciae]NKK25381.1 hypothetical protein [Rhizobium leguminosarum bv. viciae]TBX89053.1 hypothetical protein E0H31_25605 [Rhizobium leguminosarum bv. viciae]TBZ13981.1 hypothetical protein E0H52_25215 [Rhizobium leguminosarum bv. viciae]